MAEILCAGEEAGDLHLQALELALVAQWAGVVHPVAILVMKLVNMAQLGVLVAMELLVTGRLACSSSRSTVTGMVHLDHVGHLPAGAGLRGSPTPR